MAAREALKLRFLGEMEIVRGGERLELPQSKKTRALLAYLAVGGRRQRRERLCSMFWDVADDPRGALRWSLSKLRALVDEPGKRRIIADGENIAFDPAGARIDLTEVRASLADDPNLKVGRLAELAAEFRGEFLEGLELPDFHEFQAWCVAEREEARLLHVRILRMLIERLSSEPEHALPHARALVRIDPLNESARAVLVRLLAACGRRREAEQQLESGSRILKELGATPSGELAQTWREVSRQPPRRSPPASEPMPPAAGGDLATGAPLVSLETNAGEEPSSFVGRRLEWERLRAAVEEAAEHGRERVVLLCGEPGVGKSRLLAELMAEVRRRNGTVLDGCAYEAETGRPYGPWIDALRRLPAVSVGETIGADLAPLLPELAPDASARGTRDRMFGAVVELVAARAHSGAPVLIVLDDVQWCDEASAELLHYVARMSRHRPVLIALAARAGELPDNEAILRVLRGLRHDGLIEEMELGPLNREETLALVGRISHDVDGERVWTQCSGNPLFALEMARSFQHRQSDLPSTLTRLVRDRIERLPGDAANVLRWCAVVGQTFSVRRVARLTPLDLDGLVSHLEVLERHALLRAVRGAREPEGAYAFAHDLVRQVVYSEISEPRRRLMHLRIAKALEESGGADDSIASELAHHAALAGEAELAARACVRAGRRCLRLFASAEADTLARRGIHHAKRLAEPEQVKLLLELTEIRFAARRPRRPEEAARTIEELAERALDHGCLEHARLGFHMLSYLRWEGGEWSAAQRHMMRAEEISRSADEGERVVAMAEAARCLTMLERDLGQAEALLLEAGALSHRQGVEPSAIADAVGMLRLHEGRLDEAARLFERARSLARKEQHRLDEFRALEHAVMLELQRENHAEAQRLSRELMRIADRLREGSEAPFARVLAALSSYAVAPDDARSELEEALEQLRVADAKHRLAYALTRAAEVDLRRGDPRRARDRGGEALELARLLDRPTEIALARVALVRAATELGDEAEVKRQLAALNRERVRNASCQARQAVQGLRARPVPRRAGKVS